MPSKFLVAALFYGDYPDLAARCVNSFAGIGTQDVEFVLICNEVSDAGKAALQQAVATAGITDKVRWIINSENIKKYPAMRALIHSGPPISSDYFMWFDDDSYLKPELQCPEAAAKWLQDIGSRLDAGLGVLGSVYQIRLSRSQVEWIKRQPWYTWKPFGQSISFVTGGWWVTTPKLLYTYDWPIPELLHNGGDVMLGALVQQQQLELHRFNRDVAINADANGVESRAPRRGYSSKPIGMQ